MAVGLLAAVAGGCGSNNDGAAHSAPATSPAVSGLFSVTTSSTSSATGGTPPGKATSATSSGASATLRPGVRPADTPGPGATPQQYAPGSVPAPVATSFAASCVIPGGHQALTITAPAGYTVAFDTQYADGNDGSTYGGTDTGIVGADGHFTSSWTVSALAPPGGATTFVSVAGSTAQGQSTGYRQPSFAVARSC